MFVNELNQYNGILFFEHESSKLLIRKIKKFKFLIILYMFFFFLFFDIYLKVKFQNVYLYITLFHVFIIQETISFLTKI